MTAVTSNPIFAANKLRLQTAHLVADVTEARGLGASPNYQAIFVLGDDGGEFVRDPLDTASADDGGSYCGTIIRPADYAVNGVYKRAFEGSADFRFWGARPGGVFDNTAVCGVALASANSVFEFGSGTFLVSELDVADNKIVCGLGKQATTLISNAGNYTLGANAAFSTGVKESIVNVQVYDMTIKKTGTTAGTSALYAKRLTRFSFENVLCSGGEKAAYLNGCIAGSFKNSEFRDASRGIYGDTEAMTPAYNSNEISFYSCLSNYNDVGVETASNCNSWKFFGGDIEDNNAIGWLNSGVNDSIQWHGTWFEGQPKGCSFTADVRSLAMYSVRWFDHSVKNFEILAASMSNIVIDSPIIMSGTFDLTNGNGEFMNPYVDASATIILPDQGFTTNRQTTLGTNTVFSQRRNGGAINNFAGNNAPEGQVTAGPGSIYQSSSGKVWAKNTGTGNTGWRAFAECLEQTTTLDPASISAGATGTVGPFTVTGAAFGDSVLIAAPYDLAGLVVTAYVSAANAITIKLYNPTGGAIDLASGDWKIKVVKA